jgi:Domain of unknown function (DUF4389)
MPSTTRPEFEFRASPPSRQRRLTALLRVLLAVPHLIVLAFVAIAVEVVTILAWFIAIVIGRNPFHDFIVGYLRWTAKVWGYIYFLTDEYPPFTFDLVPEYPVDGTLDPGPLSRLRVLFRVVLVIPAWVVSYVLEFGIGLLGIVAWIVTVVRGSLPEPMHNAFRATIRYLIRVEAYFLLVQDRYPRGLFGDNDLLEALEERPAPEPSSEPTPFGLPTGFSGDASETAVQGPERSPWPLRLTKGGRRTLIVELVVGVVGIGGYVGVLATVASSAQDQLWSNLYTSNVVAVDSSITSSLPSLEARSPDWASIAQSCGVMQGVVDDLLLVPQYPSAGPNRNLLRGVTAVDLGDRLCLDAVQDHETSSLVQVSHLLSSARGDLTAFLAEIPAPD